MEITKDFKMVIVIDEGLPVGLQCNTAAVLSLTLGEKIKGLIGEDLKDKDGVVHTGLTKIPLPILKALGEQISQIYKESLNDQNLLMVDITDAAQTTKNYKDYEDKLKSLNELKLLGIALAGPNKLINKLTGNLALLR